MNQAKANQLQVMQYQMQREIVNVVGINIVTCGQCGQVILHKVEQEEIKCHECGFESEPCDFPDLNY